MASIAIATSRASTSCGPPHSVEAEQAVLGGLMLAPEAYDRVNDQLTESDFYRRDHQMIYRAIRCPSANGRLMR